MIGAARTGMVAVRQRQAADDPLRRPPLTRTVGPHRRFGNGFDENDGTSCEP